jgi:uncharacterized protein
VIILLSPAKSLNYDSPVFYSNYTIPHFKNEVTELTSELKKLSSSDLKTIMKVSDKLADLNHERFKIFSDKFDINNSKQALLVFDGDVYKSIEVKNFDDSDFIFAQKNLRILSGLYGVLKPLDLIQPYRLEMGTSFNKNFFVKNLYNFWGDKISKYLDDECNAGGKNPLINLASEEYFSAINSQKISSKIINIIFKEKKGGDYKIIGINAKKARGLMANFIIKNKITNYQDLKSFSSEKYSFAKERSDDCNFVFTRF